MLFRAAAILTTLACAVSSFAAPLTAPDTSAVGTLLGGLTSGGAAPLGTRQLGGVLDSLNLGTLGQARDVDLPLDNLDDILGRRDVEHPTIPDAFQGACDQILAIAVKLRACVQVAAGVDIDVKLVVGLLGQIVIVLKGLLVDLTFILKNPAGFVLTLQGKIITVKQLALIVYTLLATVVTVLAIVVRAVNITVNGVVGTLVAQIGVLLAQIIVIVLSLVGGLLIEITVLLGPIIADIRLLAFTKLIACLHIGA